MLKYRVVPRLHLLKESIITVRFLIPVNFEGKDNRDTVQLMSQQVFTFTSNEGGMSWLLHFAIYIAVI